MSGSSKASQFWDADAPFASASLVEMQKSPGLEGPLLKRMAHSLFIIFFLVFSYFLISFILLWSLCKISIIVLNDATFRFA